MNATLFWQLLLNGLSIGAVYTLVVFGLQVIIRTTGVVNFAHGQFYTIGAYAFWYVFFRLGINLWISIILTLLAMMVLAAFTYRLIFHYVQKRFRPDTPLSNKFLLSAIASVGLMMILARVIVLYFGSEQKGIPSLFPQMLLIGDVRLPFERIAILAMALIIAGLLFIFFYKTKLGKSMRAVSSDPLASALMGINSNTIFIVSFMFGCALAGLGGLLLAPVFAIDPDMGTEIIFMAMLVMVLGGITSYKGAVLSGIVVGIVLSYGYQFIGVTIYWLIFIFVILFLVFRPDGFFGEPQE